MSDPNIYFKIVVSIRYRRKEQICIISFYNDCITRKKKNNHYILFKDRNKERKMRIDYEQRSFRLTYNIRDIEHTNTYRVIKKKHQQPIMNKSRLKFTKLSTT
jgi:hypothetical protein